MNQQAPQAGLAAPGTADAESRAERGRAAIMRAGHRLLAGRTAGRLVPEAPRSAAGRAADGRAAVVAWIEEFLSIGWDTRRLREGRTFLAPEVGLVAGIAAALEDIHARPRAVLEAALPRARLDRTLPAAVPERDAFAIHAVVLRCLEMRARGRLDLSYQAARDEITGLFLVA